MRRMALAALLLTGCAAAVGAPGPGGSGVIRRHGPSTYVEPINESYGYVHYDPGYVHTAGGGISFVFGAKLGATRGSLGGRRAAFGLGSEPHADFVYVPKSDRWSATLGLGWVFQTIYGDSDNVEFNGFAPSVTVQVGLWRRLYVHAGAGVALGSISVVPDGGGDSPSADATELRALAGFTFVFRRTPMVDLALRFEGNAYTSQSVMVGGESGKLSGLGATFEIVMSYF
jgi:hypothetical protein